MSGTMTKKKAAVAAKIFAVSAVLLMVLSPFVVVDGSSTDATVYDEGSCLEIEVVYHLFYDAAPAGLSSTYNDVTDAGTTKSITYYGTVVSTEYNPQVWEFSTERWYSIKEYSDGNTIVFTGWAFGTGSGVTGAYDPGDVIIYNSKEDGKGWYVGTYDDGSADWYTRGQKVDVDGKIHVYATWDTLVNHEKDPSGAKPWTGGSKYQNIVLISKSTSLGDLNSRIPVPYTVRAFDISDIGNSKLNDGSCTLSKDTIIDNVTMYYNSGKAGNNCNINADSHVLIIGDGINSVKASGKTTGYGYFATVHGGNSGNSKMIIHSGIYSTISGGGKTGCVTTLILNGGIVLDTVNGGNTGSFTNDTGDLYLYVTGMTAYSDRYTDYLLNHEWSHISAPVTSGNLDVFESSMIVGGNYKNTAASTHVYVTGTADVWTVQAAGRDGPNSVVSGNANMEISGKAVVRNVACGSITDALKDWTDKSPVRGNIDIKVRDQPMIATLAGGGYDTYNSSVGASYQGNNIYVSIDGGTIGYVYGGGLRGPIGTAKNPTDIHIDITGGTIVKDVYGGGSGTLVKIKHRTTDGIINSGDRNNAFSDPTGIADVHGNITITMKGGVVNGSVYGGGKSVPSITKYGSSPTLTSLRNGVAAVYGDTTVNIQGGTVMNDVYGAGRGIDLALLADGQNAADNEYSSLYVIRNVSPSSSDLEFASIPWAYQDLFSDTKVKVTFNKTNVSIYEDYASVSGDASVNITNGTIKGNVYGGGAIGKVYGNTNVHITGGIIEGTAYAGGLGVVNRTSVTGKRKITVGGDAVINGSVYGGSALGNDGMTVVTYNPTGGEIEPGDVLTAGDDEYFVTDVNTDVKNGKIRINGTDYSNAKAVLINGGAFITVIPSGISPKAGDTFKTPVSGKDVEYTIKGIITPLTTADNGVQFYSTVSDATIYLKAGTIDGSVFGGGFKGKTFGDIHMFVGVDSLGLKDNDVLPDSNAQSDITIGESIYIGGDVGKLENSSEAFKNEMVMGGGELYMAQNPSVDNLSFTGSIMGSGNSCLTRGDTSIYLKSIISFSTSAAESIHRATNVTIDGCTLELNGRATIENTIPNVVDTDYSLYRIDKLVLKNGTVLVMNGGINYVAKLRSENANGDPTTSTSPFNKIVVGGGNLFILKSIDLSTLEESYGTVEGNTIISNRSDEENYGVLALGNPNSEGGFVILKAGSFIKADHSDISEDCRCWYLAGAINNELTFTVRSGNSKMVPVDMPSLQSGSSYRYTGSTFVPDSPGSVGYISKEGDAPLNGHFQARFGLKVADDEECLIFADDEAHKEKGALVKDDLGQGDPIMGKMAGETSVRNPHMYVQVESKISEYRYLGYVLICVNEVVTVELNGTPTYIVVNSIQTKVHIYTEAATFSDSSLDIAIVGGTGSSTFIIPSGYAGDNLVIDSVTPVDGASGVSAFNVTAVKNLNSTPGWTDNRGTFVIRTDGSASSTIVGTLQGGYSASLKIQVNSFTGSGEEEYDLAMRIVDGSTNVVSFTLTITVKKTPDVSVTFHVNEGTQLKYNYEYGTTIALTDCPPTDENFVGWYTDPSFNNPFTFTFPITRNMDLYARYMYAVTLDYMDGTSSVVYVAMPGGPIGAMSDPVRPGYDFHAWYTDRECTDGNEWDPLTDNVTTSMTLYAKWNGWDVKVIFKWGVTDVYLDPSEAQTHKGGLPACQFMRFGDQFNMFDTFNISGGESVMTLLEWAEYSLEKMPGYPPNYKFVYWIYPVESESDKAVPVYEDSYLNEIERLLKDGSGNYVIDEESGCYVVVLDAEISKVALRVHMDSSVVENGQSLDNLALVDPPSSFFIFPYNIGDDPYSMRINLNGATRPGYSLKGWVITDFTDGSAVFVDSNGNPYTPSSSRVPYLYSAGTEIILYVFQNEGADAATYPWIAQYKVSDNVVETMKITEAGEQRMFGEVSDNMVINFQSKWEMIPYSVSIANPAHGSIIATHDVDGTPVRFDDITLYYGDTVTLVFTPDKGYEFHHWYSSGEGIFNGEDMISATFVVQGDTCISAYLIGPQIVKIFVEYDGLYNESVDVDSTVTADGTDYTVESINTTIHDTANNVQFIVVRGEAVVIYCPSWVTVEVGQHLTDTSSNEYIVSAIDCDIKKDPENGVMFIVTDEANLKATVVQYYVDEINIPNMYWDNDGTKVYFTESVYTVDTGADDHTIVVYTGTAVLGTHDIYLEGLEFGSGYKLGMPIHSTTSQNMYYIMTPKTLYTMSDVPDGAEAKYDSTQDVYFIVTDPGNFGATIALMGDTTKTKEVITIGSTVTDGTTVYTVVGIAPGAVEYCSALKKLTLTEEENDDTILDTIYRFGYVTVYKNNVKNHIDSSSSEEIAGIGTGIHDLKEYVLNYYLTDVSDPEVDKSTDITLTLEPGYYYFNYPDESDPTYSEHSTDGYMSVTVTSYISDYEVCGTITRASYTIEIYYGEGAAGKTGTPVVVSETIRYGDNYFDLLPGYADVPGTTYKVFAWYLEDTSVEPSVFNLINSRMTVSGNPADTMVIFGRYAESNDYVGVWLRTESLGGTYSVEKIDDVVVNSDGKLHYYVDPKTGYVPKYDFDTEKATEEAMMEYLQTKVYSGSTPVGNDNPIAVVPVEDKVLIITYYRAVVNVTITDAAHAGTVVQYMYGETVPLVHTADDAEWHYYGWERNGSPIEIPVDGYSITDADVTAGAISLSEVKEIRRYTVTIMTSLAEITPPEGSKGKVFVLSLPYNSDVSVPADVYKRILRVTVDEVNSDYTISGYTSYEDYYDMTQSYWAGMPAGGKITGDVTLTYQWVPKTYTLRIIHDDTVSVSGSNSTSPIVFGMGYTPIGSASTLTVESGDFVGVKFIETDGEEHYATVIFTNSKTIPIDTVLTVSGQNYTVKAINTDVLVTTSEIKFIVSDWESGSAILIDYDGELPSKVTPAGLIVSSVSGLKYGTNIRLSLVFTGSYTIDEDNTTYINPNGGTYTLTPQKQSSNQEYKYEFFLSGDIEITIASKWIGEYVYFYYKDPDTGASVQVPEMTLLVGKDPVYISIADYEWVAALEKAGYYFDGWYEGDGLLIYPSIAYNNDLGKYCFKFTRGTQLFARYVPLVSGEYEMEFDGTEQFVSVKPEINIPLDLSEVEFTYAGGSSSSISVTEVDDVSEYSGTINYTFLPQKVYQISEGGVLRYITSGVDHVYSGSFTLSMSPRSVIVIADSAWKYYDGTPLTITGEGGYAVFGEVKGFPVSTTDPSHSGTITNVGNAAHSVVLSGISNNYSVTYYDGTLVIIGDSCPIATVGINEDEIELSGTGPITVSYSDSEITVTQGGFSKTVAGSTVKIMINGITISAADSSAMTIGSGCNVTLVVSGDNTFTGASGYDGITVESGAYLTITGTGTLTAIGNNGSDASNGGSGIGNAAGTPGRITVSHMGGLSAYGYGLHGYGIGGTGSTVIISDSTIVKAQGGHIGTGDIDFEGGPGIGGSAITITNSKLTSVVGGTKAAGIGEVPYRPVTVTIRDSVLSEVQGGSYSAGIGGSSQQRGDTTQRVTIHIDCSSVTVTGGKYGPGIGSGYDAYSGQKSDEDEYSFKYQGLCIIQITDNSRITATGGTYAASIGTGYHHANITGFIDGTVSCTTPARADSETINPDHREGSEYPYTQAQNVGYGVVDPAKEAAGLSVFFYIGQNPIDAPHIAPAA